MGGICSCFETTIISPQYKKGEDSGELYEEEEVSESRAFPTSDFLCTICIDETRNEPETRNEVEFIPCGHVYHKDCLRAWWRKNFTCPVCNLDVRLLVSSSKQLLDESYR